MPNTNTAVEHLITREAPVIPAECLERIQGELTDRVNDPALDELAGIFGAELPSSDTDARLAILTEVAASQWDFREGAERQDTNWNGPGAEELNKEGSPAWNAVFKAADKLDMVESSHPVKTLMMQF
jgi:hypothetical protein